MSRSALVQSVSTSRSVDPTVVRISEDVIEILTSGMYVDPITVYREYVQNAADAVDVARHSGILEAAEDGQVRITIDHKSRAVSILDNGCGIPIKAALSQLLAIGGSEKRGTELRGFRGVGRLSGLAYCRELVFRTKASGERAETVVTWDCRGLRAGLSRSDGKGDLRAALADAVSVDIVEVADVGAHYFEVRMVDVARLKGDVLLNEELIANFLGQVAPVPFSSEFTSGLEIDRLLVEKVKLSPPLLVFVNGILIRRPIADELAIPGTTQTLTLGPVEFLEFLDVDGQIGAVGWLCHHAYIRSLPSSLRIHGIRARLGNVQIGDDNLFEDLFRESRFNAWAIAEIHIIDKRIKPNARRDNFELSHHYYNLASQISTLASRISSLCRVSSIQRNARIHVESAIAEVKARISGAAHSVGDISQMRARLDRSKLRLRKIGDAAVEAALASELDTLDQKLEAVLPTSGPRVVSYSDVMELVGRFVTNRTQARTLLEALDRIAAGSKNR